MRSKVAVLCLLILINGAAAFTSSFSFRPVHGCTQASNRHDRLTTRLREEAAIGLPFLPKKEAGEEEVEVDDTSLSILQQQLKELSSQQASDREEAIERAWKRGLEMIGQSKFSLEVAILLAGFAFQAYRDPPDSRWAVGTQDGTNVAFQNADFVTETFQGILSIIVHKAEHVAQNYNVVETVLTGLGADPFVTVELRDSARFVTNGPQESRVMKSTASPVWGEMFFVYVSEPQQANLTLTLWDQEVTRKNIELGTAVLPVADILQASQGSVGDANAEGQAEEGYGSWEDWIELTPPVNASGRANKEVKATRVLIEAKYIPLTDESAAGDATGVTDDEEEDDEDTNAWSGPIGGTPGLDWRVLANAKGLHKDTRRWRWGRRTPAAISTGFAPTFFLENFETDTQVGAWRDAKGKRLVVSFRGTEFVKWKDFVTDASFMQTPLDFPHVAFADEEAGVSDGGGDATLTGEAKGSAAFPYLNVEPGTDEKEKTRQQMASTLSSLEALRSALPSSVTEALASLPGGLPTVAQSLREINANLAALRNLAGDDSNTTDVAGSDGGEKNTTAVEKDVGDPEMEVEMRGWFDLLAGSVKSGLDAAQTGVVDALGELNNTASSASSAMAQFLTPDDNEVKSTESGGEEVAITGTSGAEDGVGAVAGGVVKVVEGLWNRKADFNLSSLNDLTTRSIGNSLNFTGGLNLTSDLNLKQYMDGVWNVSGFGGIGSSLNGSGGGPDLSFNLGDMSAATEQLAMALDALPKKFQDLGIGADVLYEKVQSFEDALMELVVLSEPKEKVPMIHSGFKRAYSTVQKTLMTMIEAATGGEEHVKDYHIMFTGHSLGGALALLAAVDLKSRYRDAKVTTYTYGAPRVGNVFFSAIANELVPDHFRIVNKEDVIARMPRGRAVMRVLDYTHAGKTVIIDEDATGLFWVEGESKGECQLADVDPMEMFLANRVTEPSQRARSLASDEQLKHAKGKDKTGRKWAKRMVSPPGLGSLIRLVTRKAKEPKDGEAGSSGGSEGEDGEDNQSSKSESGAEELLEEPLEEKGALWRLGQRPMGFLERELKLLEGLTSGKALSHHFEADYYLAMSTCVLGKDKVKEIRELTEEKRKANTWKWPV